MYMGYGYKMRKTIKQIEMEAYREKEKKIKDKLVSLGSYIFVAGFFLLLLGSIMAILELSLLILTMFGLSIFFVFVGFIMMGYGIFVYYIGM